MNVAADFEYPVSIPVQRYVISVPGNLTCDTASCRTSIVIFLVAVIPEPPTKSCVRFASVPPTTSEDATGIVYASKSTFAIV